MSEKNTISSRASRVLAQGYGGTNSKRPTQFPENFPKYLMRGRGPYVWDEDGTKYIDFIGGLGVVPLGYGHPRVLEAVHKQANEAITLSLEHPLVIEVAEQICEMVPAIEKLRFLKTGSEATAASVRVARAYAEDDSVWSEGYHGWHDMFTSLTAPALGVPTEGDWDHCIQSYVPSFCTKNGTFICEPVGLDMSDSQRKGLRQDCQAKKPVIFDEVITFGRVPKWSVSRMWDLKPELTVLGKGLASGFPLSVVGGKKEIMDCGEYFVSSTFSGEAVSLAAAKATLTELRKTDMKEYFYYSNKFQDNLNKLFKEVDVQIEGYGTRGMYPMSSEAGALLSQELCKAGILMGKAYFYSIAHMEENLDEVILNLVSDVVGRIKRGECKLEGEVPVETFKR